MRPIKKDCAGVFFVMIKNRGMREIQAKKGRPNLGAEKAVRAPLVRASPISIILICKIEIPELNGILGMSYREILFNLQVLSF